MRRVLALLGAAESRRVLSRAFWLVTIPFAIELALILWLCEGSFTYSLDDPYIHLALADQIARGHYGIHAGAASSPSSSILWPFLLVPWTFTGLSVYAPLILNYAATLALAAILFASFSRLGAPLSQRLQVSMVGLGLLLLNAFPLAFMGLEHSLQVLLALLVALGLIRSAKEGAPPKWMPWAVVLGPLVRYESFVLVCGSCLYFFLERRRKFAVSLFAASCVGPLGFSAFLLSRGLPKLPLSVEAKSLVPLDGGLVGLITAVSAQVEYALVRSNRGPVFAIAVLCLLYACSRTDARAARRLAGASILPIVLHVCFAQFGRYEVYLWAYSLAVLGFCLRRFARTLLERPTRAMALLIVFTGLMGTPYLARLLQTPFGARSIRAQQGSTARVARQLGEPIGVNDLGLVAYGNPNFVLDLYGLASAEALAARRAGRPGFLSELVRKHRVRIVAIYPSWFSGQIPASWLPVADIVDPRPWASTAEPAVRFYAIVPEAVAPLRAALRNIEARPSAGELVRFLSAAEP